MGLFGKDDDEPSTSGLSSGIGKPSYNPSDPSPSGGRPAPGSAHGDRSAGLKMLNLETNGLYILLSQLDAANKWHWALYLHKGDTAQGGIFHITDVKGPWRYEHLRSPSVIYDANIVVALKVAVVEPVIQPALIDALETIPMSVPQAQQRRFGREITCRVWIMVALDMLDQHGYLAIKLPHKAEDIEYEAKGKATEVMAMSPGGHFAMAPQRVFSSFYSKA